MPFVEAKCTNCGHTLKVDSSKEAAVCEFCDSAFIVEKAINNYNSYNQYQIEHANIQLNDERSVEKRLENAGIFFKDLNEPDKAREIYKSVTEDSPGDYRGWWGLAQVLSNDFKYINCGATLYNEINQYALSAMQFAPSELSDEYAGIVESFKKEHVAYLTKENNEIIKLEKELSDLMTRQVALRNEFDAKARSQDAFASFEKLFIWGALLLIITIGPVFMFHYALKGISKYNIAFIFAEIIMLALLGACLFGLYKIVKDKRERFSSNLYMTITQNDRTIAVLTKTISTKKRNLI